MKALPTFTKVEKAIIRNQILLIERAFKYALKTHPIVMQHFRLTDEQIVKNYIEQHENK